MNTRIKKIREHRNLTQEEFGKKIGCARNTIANYENGNRNPSNSIIKSICREYGVNENWLRTGEGEMPHRYLIKDEVGYYIEELLDDYGDNPFYDMVLDLVKTYSELDEKSKEVIRRSAEKLKENMEARASKSAPASQDT